MRLRWTSCRAVVRRNLSGSNVSIKTFVAIARLFVACEWESGQSMVRCANVLQSVGCTMTGTEY